MKQGYKTEKLFIALNKLAQDQSLHPLCNTLSYILFLSFGRHILMYITHVIHVTRGTFGRVFQKGTITAHHTRIYIKFLYWFY